MIVTLVACQVTAPAVEEPVAAGGEPHVFAKAVRAADLKALPPLSAIIPRLAEKQVVFVGETHDQFAHHLAQLEIIRGLHAIHDELVIGLEFFQVPFQQALDTYIAGRSTEEQLLKQTEYFERWRFDYRLYRPILRYAREHSIPLIALNIPSEISRKVARSGIESLSADEQAQIPQEIDRSDQAYRERLRAVFETHRERGAAPGSFDHFVDSQLLWDEGMAETAAKYLRAHPGRHMVILAGSGHLLYGSGIPGRLLRRVSVASVIVINAGAGVTDPQMADFLLFPAETTLPPAGLLGVFLQQKNGSVVIDDVTADGAAERAGLQKGDLLLALDGTQMSSVADVKIALLDKRAGEQVRVRVKRGQASASAQLIEVDIALMSSH
ncbi:MAG: ChaN family lipoprotein [Acidiferrobacterales bacterium]|nr:ChaN family lipoprotein [Acidiferrobacterales bacterium]